jgi:hypothetical protein
MTTERLVTEIAKNQPHVVNGNGLENTIKLIREYDMTHPDSSIIVLLGAGDIDGIRNDIL